MADVKNKVPVRRLTMRYIKSNKGMNVVVITAIALTCVLFTALFSIGISLVRNFEEQTMRQVGTSSMAGVKYILPEDVQRITADKKIRNVGIKIIVGHGTSEQFRNISAEINCINDTGAKNMFCYPTTGRMPEAIDEIAVADAVLDELGVPHKVGEMVKLDIDIDGKIQKDQEFTLTGFWETDYAAMAQQIWVSKKYCDTAVPVPASDKAFAGKYAGYYCIDFDFANSLDIEGKTNKLLERCGYDPESMHIGINWAFSASNIDTDTFMGIAALLLIIIAAGYLIIYNVFLINVTANIRQYGLLKTIGTTSRQLKKMIRMQAAVYSAEGIIPGSFIGTVISYFLMPVITNTLSGAEKFSLVFSPLIYILAAVFTLATVFISCLKPAKAAGRVSPVEALRYTESTSGLISKNERKAHSVNSLSMAWSNIMRSRKKLAAAVLSLSLSIILTDAVFMIISGLDMDKYVRNYIVGDFRISCTSMAKLSFHELETQGISESDREFIKSIDGVSAIGNVWYMFADIVKGGEPEKRMNDYLDTHPDIFRDKMQELAGQFTANFRNSDTVTSDIYGIDESILKYFSADEKIDEEKFRSGKYVIINSAVVGEEDKNAYYFYKPGERVKIKFPDGSEEEYEIMAAAAFPYSLSTQMKQLINIEAVIPSEEFLKHSDKTENMFTSIEAEEGKQDSVRSALDHYITNENSSLGYMSKQDYIDEFKGFYSMFAIVGGTLSGVLAVIGILNFINAVSTSIYARKREFAMMQAVGMTGLQLKKMLICEGLLYAMFTSVITILSGFSLIPALIRMALGGNDYFTLTITAVPFMVSLPVLYLFACIIPYCAYKWVCRSSVIERLRENE